MYHGRDRDANCEADCFTPPRNEQEKNAISSAICPLSPMVLLIVIVRWFTRVLGRNVRLRKS